MLYKIVDLYFEINTKYDYSKERLCDYETDEKRTPDLVIEISDEEITNEEKNNPGFNNPYYEFICILRRVVDFVIDYDSLFVHSALISFDDDGNIHVKNTSAYWIPELTVIEEISGTIYTVTGSYEGEDSFIRKLERIASRKFTNQLGGHQ